MKGSEGTWLDFDGNLFGKAQYVSSSNQAINFDSFGKFDSWKSQQPSWSFDKQFALMYTEADPSHNGLWQPGSTLNSANVICRKPANGGMKSLNYSKSRFSLFK